MDKMDPEVKALWLTALRSGEYRQTTENLKIDRGDGKGVGYCCLGVLCELAVSQGVELSLNFDTSIRETCDNPDHPECKEVAGNVVKAYDFNGSSSYLPDKVQEWAGLKYRNPSVLCEGYGSSLAALNDNKLLDFDAIADIVEEQL